MRCKLTRLTFTNPFKGSTYKESIHANYECALSYYKVRCSTHLKDLLMHMTQKDPRNRVTASTAKNHRFFYCEPVREKHENTHLFSKYRHLVNS